MSETKEPIIQPGAAQSTQPDDHIILSVRHLKKYFPIRTGVLGQKLQYVRAVDDISFNVRAGRTVGIVGESGCGKTTMGRTVLRLYSVTGGQVLFNGMDLGKMKARELRKIRPQIQMIFQDPYASLNARMTVCEIIKEPMDIHSIGTEKEKIEKSVDITDKL